MYETWIKVQKENNKLNKYGNKNQNTNISK